MRKATLSSLAFSIFLIFALVIMPGVPAYAAQGAADPLADFEGLAAPPGFGAYADSPATTVAATPVNVADSDPLARPGQAGDNGVLAVSYNVILFGGFGQAFDPPGPRNWSNYRSFDFWFYGTGSGLTYQAEISDNRFDPNVDTSERFDFEFTDTTPGWQHISIPFGDFTRATDWQPAGAPDDGFTLTEIWGWNIVLPVGADTVYFDNFATGLRIVDDFESGFQRRDRHGLDPAGPRLARGQWAQQRPAGRHRLDVICGFHSRLRERHRGHLGLPGLVRL